MIFTQGSSQKQPQKYLSFEFPNTKKEDKNKISKSLSRKQGQCRRSNFSKCGSKYYWYLYEMHYRQYPYKKGLLNDEKVVCETIKREKSKG